MRNTAFKRSLQLRKHHNEIKKCHFEEDSQLMKQENELIAKPVLTDSRILRSRPL
jgi:hypothetical protein